MPLIRDKRKMPGDAPPTAHLSWRLSGTRVVSGGIDLVDLERLSLAARRSGEMFISRILTHAERDLVGSGAGSAPDHPNGAALAALFGAKESVIKLVGGFPASGGFHDIALPQAPSAGAAAVAVQLHGPLQHWARRRQVRVWCGLRSITPKVSLAWAVATPEDADTPRVTSTSAGDRS